MESHFHLQPVTRHWLHHLMKECHPRMKHSISQWELECHPRSLLAWQTNFDIADKCKSSDEVISLYKFYKNAQDIGKLAIALVKYTYFGSATMSQCTVTGQGETTAFDPIKLGLLRGNIRAIFPQMDDEEFNKTIWEKCKESLEGACKYLRAASGRLWVEVPPHTTSCDFNMNIDFPPPFILSFRFIALSCCIQSAIVWKCISKI